MYNVIIHNIHTLPKTNIDTQNDGLEKVPSKMAIVGIYVRFLRCIGIMSTPKQQF